MERKPLVVGNWKMALSHKSELEVARAVHKLLREGDELSVEVVVCPSFPSLAGVAAEYAKNARAVVGAQHVHWEERGAWTGSVSVTQINPFVKWCIVGHSEQRELTGMTDEQAAAAAALLLRHGIMPVICIGETAAEREADTTVEKVTRQMKAALAAIARSSLPKVAIAYEPIWAISSQQPDQLPDPDETAGTMLLMRKLAAKEYGNEAAQRLRILYGGSVTPENVDGYVQEPGVDGVLVGGASTHPRDFVDIVQRVAAVPA